MQAAIHPPKSAEETTIKVPREIRDEMLVEYKESGYPSLAAYTRFLLSKRKQIMEVNTPLIQDFTAQPPPAKRTHELTPEAYEEYRQVYADWQKLRRENEQKQQMIQGLSSAIEQLIDEATACTGSFFGNYTRDYFEAKVLEFLRKEGITTK